MKNTGGKRDIKRILVDDDNGIRLMENGVKTISFH